jgi:hypothetical protein
MITFGGFSVGLACTVTGFLIIKNAYYLNHQMFFLDFWEKKFGQGTGTNGYQLIGLMLVILGAFSMLGILDLTANPVGDSAKTQTSISPQFVPVNNRGNLIGR